MVTEEQSKSAIKKYLTAEVKFIIWVIAFVWGIAVPYFWIKQDIALIKENHMTHMEAFDKELVRLNTVQERQWNMLIELMKDIAGKSNTQSK